MQIAANLIGCPPFVPNPPSHGRGERGNQSGPRGPRGRIATICGVARCASPTANPVGATATSKGCLRMPGYARDLATLEPWEASLARSRARRRRDAGRSPIGSTAKRVAIRSAPWDPMSLAALIDARREAARDLAEHEPWELSLGRSRARRRAAQLRFVPASSRAKRLSLGALVALTAGPAAALLDSGGGVAAAGAAPAELDPVTTTTHQIVLAPAAKAVRCACCSARSGSRWTACTGPQPKRRCAASSPRAGSPLTGSSAPTPPTRSPCTRRRCSPAPPYCATSRGKPANRRPGKCAKPSPTPVRPARSGRRHSEGAGSGARFHGGAPPPPVAGKRLR